MNVHSAGMKIMNDSRPNGVMIDILEQAYLEVIPTETIAERLVHIPHSAYVAITCSPTLGVEPTLQIVEQLSTSAQAGKFKLVPHIAARMIRDKSHLRDVIARLDDFQIQNIFVPGGDAPKATGDYDGALALLRDIADIGHKFEGIGIAAHPEGHPHISDEELVNLLLEKQQFATYLVTQMCFDPGVLMAWVQRIRESGITLPAWIGLPGVADMTKLISLSLRIGVGQSVNIVRKQKGLLKKVLGIKPYQPDDLLAGLAPHLNDSQMNIPGFHLFSFNDVERTERWRRETLASMR
jgi:methylenetetrahydrofolate reductase (NADPH)